MKILIKGIREGLGRIIVLIDWVFSPRRLKRTQADQTRVDQQTQSLKLYQFYACPFCVKTRRAFKHLNIAIETRNAQSGKFRDELLAEGGKVQVPCLRVQVGDKITWMYVHSDIIAYLEQRFRA